MSKPFITGEGDWSQYRDLPNLVEVDFHWLDRGGWRDDGARLNYHEKMGEVTATALRALETDQMMASNTFYLLTAAQLLGWGSRPPGRK